MSLTHSQLAALVEEVTALAVPGGVQKVFEREAGGFALQLRSGGATHYLCVAVEPPFPRFHLAASKPAQPAQPSGFVMLLRKHLVGGGLQACELRADDRIVELRFTRRSDEVVTQTRLVLELFVGGRAHLLHGGEVYEAPPAPGTLEGADPWSLRDMPLGERSAFVEAALDAAVAEHDHTERRQRLQRALKAEAGRTKRLVANLERDLQRAEDAQEYRRRAQLLQSAYALDVPRGAKSVRVPDFYEPGAPEIELALDPARSLKENIERLFHEYRRYKAAIDRISERLLTAMERVEAVEAARTALRDASDEELEELDRRLGASGLLARKRQQQRRKTNHAPQLPYRTFVARSGAKILVGRGAKHNDALTTKVARGRDVWMHARDWAGAHVVLRMDKDGEPHGDDLRDAALLAAHFSKGRQDSLVDVTFTRAKWVRKPKGAAPGLVTVAGGATIGVAPDPDRLAALFDAEVLDE